jgi:hypothetical protein
VLATEYSTKRAHLLAERVTTWYDDPRQEGRQVGLVTAPTDLYPGYSVPRGAVRCRQANGQWAVGVVVSTLTAADALTLTAQDPARVADPLACLLAYVYLYDQRGGGVETACKGDKHGLGLPRRNTKRFPPQQVVTLLAALAHNVLSWARRWLAVHEPRLRQCGIKRLVREVLAVQGLIAFDAHAQVCHVLLNQADRLAQQLAPALQRLLAAQHVTVTLGEI